VGSSLHERVVSRRNRNQLEAQKVKGIKPAVGRSGPWIDKGRKLSSGVSRDGAKPRERYCSIGGSATIEPFSGFLWGGAGETHFG